MAGGAVLGNLLYIIKARNAEFKQKIDENKKKIRELNKEVENQKEKFKKNYGEIAETVRNAGFALTAFAAGVGAAGFKLAQIAGEAEDTQGKFEAVFKDMTDEATAFVQHFSSQFDLADSSVQEWLATLKDTFDPLGIAADRSMEWGKELVALALDVKTFYPSITSVNDAIGRFTSYLVGNHEAVREMGVVVNETMIKNKAYEMGIAKVGEELTEVQKMTVRYELLLNGLANAKGNATRELDGFNMALTQIKEIAKETAEVYGKDVIPIFTQLLNIVKSILKWLRDLPPEIRTLVSEVGIFVTLVAGLTGPLFLIIGYLPQIAAGLKLVSTSFAPFLISGAIVAGLAMVFSWIQRIRDETQYLMRDVNQVVDLTDAQKQLEAVQNKIEDLRQQKEKDQDMYERVQSGYYNASAGRMLEGREFVFARQEELEQLIEQEKQLQTKIEELKELKNGGDDAETEEDIETLKTVIEEFLSWKETRRKDNVWIYKKLDELTNLDDQIKDLEEARKLIEDIRTGEISPDHPFVSEFHLDLGMLKKIAEADLTEIFQFIDAQLLDPHIEQLKAKEKIAKEHYSSMAEEAEKLLSLGENTVPDTIRTYKELLKEIEDDTRLSYETREQLIQQFNDKITRLEFQRDAEIENLNSQLLQKNMESNDETLKYKIHMLEEEREAVKESFRSLLGDSEEFRKKETLIDEVYDRLRLQLVEDYDDQMMAEEERLMRFKFQNNVISLKEYREYLEKRRAEFEEYSEDWIRINNELKELDEPVLNWAEQFFVDAGYAANEAQNHFQNFKDSLVDGLTNAITKGEDFLDTLKNIGNQIASLIIKRGIIEPFVDELLGKGGSGGLVGNIINWLSSMATAHTGGLVTVNGIDTFHTGGMVGMEPLGHDEKIIKTKVGEIILNENQQRGLINSQQSTRPEVNVEVINNTGTPVQTRKEVQFDGTRTIVRMFMEGYARNMEGIQDVFKRR